MSKQYITKLQIRVKKQQELIDAQRRLIESLEKGVKLSDTLWKQERNHRHELQERIGKILSATLFQRIFKWKDIK